MGSILCIETATHICSVCIARDGELIAERETTKSMSHTSLTSVFVKDLLEEIGLEAKDLAAVAVSGGPGSYTGLRVGISLAKGICAGANVPLIAVNTLESLGLASIGKFKEEAGVQTAKYLHIPMIDARRMEVYMAAYTSDDACILENEPKIIEKDSFSAWIEEYDKIILSGDGAEKCIAFLENPGLVDSKVRCSASNLIKPAFIRLNAAKFDDLAYYSPNYIKSPNITKARKALF